MKNNLLVKLWVIAVIVSLAACGSGTQPEEAKEKEEKDQPSPEDMPYGSGLESMSQRAFFNQLATYCGQSFSGKQVFMAPERDSWEDKKFVMHVTVCEDDHIHIPFHVDEDQSRTWMFLVEDGRLRFRHDHRHEDGTPEEVTLYGGYGDGKGDRLMQRFPADDYTCQLLPDNCNSIWQVELTEDPGTFNYSLFSGNNLVFTATFDLTKPLEI